jgi:hypothetical protein
MAQPSTLNKPIGQFNWYEAQQGGINNLVF